MVTIVSVILAMFAGLIVSFVIIQVIIGAFVFLWDNAIAIVFIVGSIAMMFILEIHGGM